MTAQLPAVIPFSALAPLGDTHLVPTLIANEGAPARASG
jgi:hypothetical protein